MPNSTIIRKSPTRVLFTIYSAGFFLAVTSMVTLLLYNLFQCQINFRFDEETFITISAVIIFLIFAYTVFLIIWIDRNVKFASLCEQNDEKKRIADRDNQKSSGPSTGASTLSSASLPEKQYTLLLQYLYAIRDKKFLDEESILLLHNKILEKIEAIEASQ